MYGLVNQAIQGLVTDQFGQDAWIKVKAKAGVTEETFLSNQIYDDSMTFDLAQAASDVLSIPLKDVLHTFGKYWVLKVGQVKYGTLMKSGGDSFEEFLINLPNFHSRVMLIYADIKPPEFKIERSESGGLLIHYYSIRTGLTDFMHGLVDGLAEMFETKVSTTCIQSKLDGFDHDIFEIKVLS